MYLGVVTGDAEWVDSPDNRSNLRRTLAWRTVGAPVEFADLPAPLPAKLSSQSDVVDLTEELALLERLLGEDLALTEPSRLIIDEINRGNLAKIFGELYFLLEYRGESIGLLYSAGEEDDFTLPANVFLIGTMNTADRSIALVDTAMRRRFAFVSLHPAQEPVRGLLGRWLAERGYSDEPAQLLGELNRRMADLDYAIGPSYLMRDSVTDGAWLERIWRTSIMPLLEELHYGETIDFERQYGIAALRKSIAARTGPAPDAEE